MLFCFPGCFPNKETGRCRAAMPKYFFNTKTGQCERFIYGGCGGNDNRFDTLTGCHRTCTCKTEAEAGPCRGHLRRWFYSAADGCCRPFIYGGCGGNSNNYETWTQCSELCGYPTMDSTFWQWGLDWLKWLWQQNQNRRNNTIVRPIRPNRYSKDDFMRDWVLWGLLTGGEGEIEMEEMATMIAQAHILGFGQASGGNTGMASVARAPGNYTMADTRAALGYFQRHLGGDAAEGAYGNGMLGRAMAGVVGTLGPAYSIPRQGSFTPLGEIGTAENYINLQTLLGTGGLGAGMSADMNGEIGGGYLGQGYTNNQQFGGGYRGGVNNIGGGQFRQGYNNNQQMVQANQILQGAKGNQQQYISNQHGRVPNQGGWQTNQGGRQSNRQGMQTNQRGYQNMQQQAASRSAAMRAAANDANWQGAYINARVQNMGNTREGWAPHLQVTPGVGGAMLEMFNLIKQLSTDNLNPFGFHNLARRFGALEANGQVNVEKLAQRLVSSLTSASGTAKVSGVARSLGAVDAKGNIDFKKLMAEISKSVGKGGLFGLNWGGTWDGKTRSGGTGFEMGGFGGRQSRRGAWKKSRSRSMNMSNNRRPSKTRRA